MPLLILLVVVSVLCGPAALIVSIAALKRIELLRQELHAERGNALRQTSAESPSPTTTTPPVVQTAEPERPHTVRAVRDSEAISLPAERPDSGAPPYKQTPPSATREAEPVAAETSLEQRIGTRWVLIAGVVTVIFAVGFFLKYAYENEWVGPLGRVFIAAVAGLLAVGIGELTRRRGYEIVAKGVTAMGFAILYATVFAAHRWYDQIDSAPAYGLAIGITVAAMLYAVAVNEVIVAILSLAGGYVTPILLSRGENLPNLLFGYVLVLSAGATLCAYWRKWTVVNVLAFLGTYGLYTGWFEKFYRPAMRLPGTPAQFGVALAWLAVFFGVYLLLPVLHTLLRRVRSEVQDMVLVLANAGVVFYYLWTVLTPRHEKWLALCSVLMGAAYLVLMGLVFVRCRADRDLRNALLVAGLALITLAVPLYFEMYAVAMIWAVEVVALTATGLRYRNSLVQVAGGAVLGLAIGQLAMQLPMHAGTFQAFWNPVFGTWAFTAGAAVACHILYRLDTHVDADTRNIASQLLYAAGMLLLMLAVSIELWHYWRLTPTHPFVESMTFVLAVFVLLFAARPICPPGRLCQVIAAMIACLGSALLIVGYSQLHVRPFTAFLNADFARSLLFVAALFASAWFLRRAEWERKRGPELSAFVALAAVLLIWVLVTQEIWLHYRRARGITEWRFLAQMFISVAWAVYATVLMIVGFWRRVRPLRYVALGIFVLLLAKIFLVDTRTIETIYRIGGFLVTGLALVGVSYLYQYLRKKGFFNPAVADEGLQG